MAAIVTVACLKTAVGLITSCGETFFVACTGRAFLFCLGGGLLCTVFFDRESGPGYDPCYSAPVLMFLYPLAIVLVLLTLFGKAFGMTAW